MRLLLWSMICSVLILFLVAEIASPTIRSQHNVHVLPVHKTLYMARDTYSDEFYHLVEATMEWNNATNGNVVFDIKMLPQHNIDVHSSIIIFNVGPDNPDIITLDNEYPDRKYEAMAFFDDRKMLRSIAMVDERISDSEYTSVFEHELGHALGLEHIKGEAGIGTLMSESIDEGSMHITNTDLKYFCKLYHCDASKFHGQSQIQ